jgi:hypothetical protein
LRSGLRRSAEVAVPPGAPGRPPDPRELHRKAGDCAGEQLAETIIATSWSQARALALRMVPAGI